MEKQSRQTDGHFAAAFYVSRAWQRTREAYAVSRSGLCERCAARGLVVPGTQVHHRVRLTPDNLSDARVTLAWSNLELLCDECHRREHDHRQWRADADGHVDL